MVDPFLADSRSARRRKADSMAKQGAFWFSLGMLIVAAVHIMWGGEWASVVSIPATILTSYGGYLVGKAQHL